MSCLNSFHSTVFDFFVFLNNVMHILFLIHYFVPSLFVLLCKLFIYPFNVWCIRLGYVKMWINLNKILFNIFAGLRLVTMGDGG